MKKTIMLISMCLKIFLASAQDIFPPDSIKKKLEAVKFEGNIKIDGQLNEPEWKLATTVPNFIQMEPSQGVESTKKTVTKVIYNKSYLYISAICYDSIGKSHYRVSNLKRDFPVALGDDFLISIDTYNDERNAASFIVNPYGGVSDWLTFDDNYSDVDWDGLWMARTLRTDSAWIAEIAIPWQSLRYKNNGDSLQTWGVIFGRTTRAINEYAVYPSIPRAYSPYRMNYAAKLVNINVPKPSANIRVQPFSLFSYSETKESSKKISSDNTFKFGGDAKWAINTNTLLDFTVNTDFAQSEVDRQVNNINRFSVFFPEKRQFFLENAGLFAVGVQPLGNGLADYSTYIQPFFSRTIGLDASGRPLNITGGARLVNRTDKKSIGALLVRQDGNEQTNPAYFMTGRYSQNIGKQNRIGALISYKIEEEKLDSISVDKGFTGTVDGFARFSQPLSISYFVSTTTERNNTTPGYASAFQLQYNSNNLVAWFTESIVTKDYNPKMGFVSRENAIVTEPGFYYQIRTKWFPKFVRAIYPGASYILYHNPKTLALTDRYLNIIPLWMRLQNATLIYYNITFTKQIVDERFYLLGSPIQKGAYQYTTQKLGVSSDQSKKISVSVTGNKGKFYNGNYNSVVAKLTIAPIPHIFISSGIEKGKVKDFGENSESNNITLYTVEGRLALNPRLQLSALFQQYSLSNSAGWNFRFSWELAPLSYFYMVYNNNTLNNEVKYSEQKVITKISYLKQF